MKLEKDRIVMIGSMLILIVPIILSLIKHEVYLFPWLLSIFMFLVILIRHCNTIEFEQEYLVIKYFMKRDEKIYYKDIVKINIYTDSFLFGRTIKTRIKTQTKQLKVHLNISASEKDRIATALNGKVECIVL